MKKVICLILFIAVLFSWQIFAEPENAQGYPHSYDTSGTTTTNNGSGSTTNNNGNGDKDKDKEGGGPDLTKETEEAAALKTEGDGYAKTEGDINTGTTTNASNDAEQKEESESQKVADVKSDAEGEKKVNKNESEATEDSGNSETPGDPVQITKGAYEQTETDFTIGKNIQISIIRQYKSDNNITGSFGYGWSTNLDERIILGTESGLQKIIDAIKTYLDNLKSIISNLEKALAEAYKVTSIYNAKNEINSKLSSCNTLSAQLTEFETRVSTFRNSVSSYKELADKADAIKSAADTTKTNVASKKSTLQDRYNTVDYELAAIRRLNYKYSEAETELEQKQKLMALEKERRERNKKAMFPGMGKLYEETGLDTITVIDSEGYPHILYEKNGLWKNENEKAYLHCEEKDRNLILYESDGTIKRFDDYGFLIQIKDRNGNAINIVRNSDEKILYVDTSDNEHYDFEYTNGFVSKITNVRSTDENVVYTYRGSNLVSVKDTDGDTVTMDYDSNNRMISLNKCDRSFVTFTYGEQDNNGNVFTTATTNEEGYSERFSYDRNVKRADYIDHDGNKTSFWYDGKHRTVKQLQPDGTLIQKSYDESNNLISINTNGDVVRYSYDAFGNRTQASYSDGSYETWNYDSFNLITFYKDRDGVKQEYIRDKKGNLIELKNGSQTVYKQKFNSKGQLIQKTIFGNRNIIIVYLYDGFGNLESESCDGIKKEYEYDSRNRITKIKIDGKTVTEYEYEAHATTQKNYNGLETVFQINGRKDLIKIRQKDTVTDDVHETRVEYDKRHLPVKVFVGNGETEKLTTSYAYTKEGKLRAEILHGDESWIKLYEYKNGQISEIKQLKVAESVENISDDNILNSLLHAAGDNIYIQKYNQKLLGSNKKLIEITDALGIQILFEYDSYGNLVKNTNGNGEVTQSRYTKAGRLSAEQSLHGGWYEYGYGVNGLVNKVGEQNNSFIKVEYYADGNVKSRTDRYGKNTYYSYDSHGRVESIKSEARTIWYEYDDFDRLVKQTVGNTTVETSAVYFVTYDYSEDGRTVTVTEGGKYKTVYDLDAFGNVTGQTDGNANKRSFVYSIQNQMIESYDGYNNKTAYEYNTLGNVSKQTMPDGTEIDFEYNYMGQLVKITDATGTVYEASYDKSGHIVKERNRADREKIYEYDRAGRIIRVLCGNEAVESYSYGVNGRTVTVKDGKGEEYLYNYDAFGRLVHERNRNGLEQDYYYDEEGQLKSKNNFDGGTTTIEYSQNRTIRMVHYSDGSRNSFVYDAMGNIVEASNAYGKTEYRYDHGGKLVCQKDVTTGEEVYFTYDDAGNRIKLYSSNRETAYRYGRNNEVLEVSDNKQRINMKLQYDINGREVSRLFGNGTREDTLYDKSGRIIVKMHKGLRGELLWGEGYVYGDDGKQTATIDNKGRVTFYEYNKKGQLETVYYPYTQEMVNKLKEEAETNGLTITADTGINRYLSGAEKATYSQLMNTMQYGLAYSLPTLHTFIKESYKYDKNGNRLEKQIPYGTIQFTYNKENCLLSSGSRGQVFVTYTYDKMGNLLTEKSALKTTKYAYNSQNRMIYCEVTDKSKKEYAQTVYAYDAFGRRVIVQDKGESALRTLYDGLTFDVIKQSQTFANGLFTDSLETGIRWSRTGKPTGDRYRYISDEEADDGNRYFYIEENTYKNVNTRYQSERTHISVNSTLAAQTTSTNYTEYFVTDILGSVKEVSDSYAISKVTYSYDAFGSLVQGNLSNSSDFGYLAKQIDDTAKLYNYGYRDYHPQIVRFSTVDPIRDGTNWFAYVNNDPINFIDLWGLLITDKDLAGVPPQYRQSLIEQYRKNKQQEDCYQWPLSSNVVTSEFGYRNDAIPNKHDGLDLRAQKGTPVYAMADGKVSLADLEYSGSNSESSYLVIQGTDGYEQRYVHMDSFTVEVNDAVTKGQLLGYTGDRKDSEEHLHIEIRNGRRPLNPRTFLPKN